VDERLAAGRGQAAEPAWPDQHAPVARPGLRHAIRSRLTAEQLLVLVLALGVLAVHDVGFLLRQPFWNDEAWVAVTTRFPLSQLPQTTSSTPIGWSVLMRLITIGGTQSSRLLPLAFAGLAVAVGYWLARELGWQARSDAILAGTLAGLAVLLVPAMLQRDDLKQYTADACLALLALALTSRLEQDWSRRRLAQLSLAVAGGMLLSDDVAFVGVAAFMALCVVQLARRAWRQLAEAAVAGAGTAALMACVYAAFDSSAAAALGDSSHWNGYYVPLAGGLRGSLSWVTMMIGRLRADFGLGPAWLAVPLVLAGLITIFRLGRPATALTAAALMPEMIVLSMVKVYPFGDLRTSTWLITVIVALAAIGIGGICAVLRDRLRGGAAAWLAVSVVAVAAVAGCGIAAAPYVRSHHIPDEDVRDQASYVAGHAKADDVILVNSSSNWGFAYYWPYGTPARRVTGVDRQGYLAYFPRQLRIIIVPNRYLGGITGAVQKAIRRAQLGSCASIWLIRTHVSSTEQAAWASTLASARLAAVPVGGDGLAVIRPAGRSCH
jgi:hypothetical protein